MGTSERTSRLPLWLSRATWLALPLAGGPAIAGLLDQGSRATQSVGEWGLWAVWLVGLVATLAPRPLGLTVLRVLGPGAFLVAALTTTGAPAHDSVPALTVAAAVAALPLLPEMAEHHANGASYGRERRLPLRTPWTLSMAIAPAAVLTILLSVATGVVLLANGRLVGIAILATGGLLSAFLGRSLHALSRRWLVLVPGGVVVHDPLTLANATLVPWHSLAAIAPLEPAALLPPDALDLRLGARAGTLVLSLSAPLSFPARSRTRGEVTMVTASRIAVAAARPGRVLAQVTSAPRYLRT